MIYRAEMLEFCIYGLSMSTCNSFVWTIKVYRHAAQCALSAKDLAEYHVCALSLVTRIFPALEDLEKHRFATFFLDS